ncbi:hypothetical protein KF707_18620 [Candidatus Obscuribacterales bacterium]|nr:hypothetical protein [Candidatus Obscuribacterales bacterium]MBX3138250.1 hypothetical protein [Candidatus Obscuribacterales bacterium]MBX3148852.1 hypothetical protein [Candidatus Obscuribacterales bacterium]
MSQSQSVDVPDPASLDGLDQMFSPAAAASSSVSGGADGVRVHRNLPSDLFTRGFDGVDEIVTEELEQNDYSVETIGTFDYAQMHASAVRRGKLPPKPGPVARNIKADELAPVEDTSMTSLTNTLITEDDRVSRNELVSLLEGFVQVLKGDDAGNMRLSLAKAQQLVSAPEEVKYHDIRVEDKTQELEEMRRLVIEAQETIIKLLTDRVEDRARIATLETELRLLPDLQDQADRAMSVAFKTEEFRSELHKVKFELERYRLASARGHVQRGPRYWMSRVRRWFLKAQGLKLQQYSDATRKLD